MPRGKLKSQSNNLPHCVFSLFLPIFFSPEHMSNQAHIGCFTDCFFFFCCFPLVNSDLHEQTTANQLLKVRLSATERRVTDLNEKSKEYVDKYYSMKAKSDGYKVELHMLKTRFEQAEAQWEDEKRQLIVKASVADAER